MEKYLITVKERNRPILKLKCDDLNEVFMFLGEQIDFSYADSCKLDSSAFMAFAYRDGEEVYTEITVEKL